MPQSVVSPSNSVPQRALAFGAFGADAIAVEREAGLPIESAAAGAAGAIIAAGASLSPAIDLDRQRLHRLILPAGWTAAAISFQSSHDGTLFADLYDAAGEVVLPSSVAQAGRAVIVDAAAFYGVRWLKLRSGAAGAPVAQAGERAIALATVAR